MSFQFIDIDPGQLMSGRVKSKQLFVSDLSAGKDGSHIKFAAGSFPLYGVAELSIHLERDDEYAREMGAALVDAARRVNEKYGLPI